jgi:hypothetical protein
VPRFFRVYLGALVTMMLFMVSAIAVAWPGLGRSERLVYTGLAVLGAYMLVRAVRARGLLSRRGPGWLPRYLDDIGFTLISLFDGFVIVSAIDLGAPGWLVAVVAVAGVVVGIQGVNRAKARHATAEVATSS